ncbi:arylsulfotransferase family protein [Fluviibacterium sp. DFM31]|uniref:Arylsulfotransferase family protein n=1 Tax=Meridianimarinicoccus marinus TaxID=3231483 RepID=A0ABV3L2U5_9RHOB
MSRLRSFFEFFIPITSGLVLGIFLGALLGVWKLPPYPQIQQAIQTARTLYAEGKAMMGVEPVQHLAPLRDQPPGISVPLPDRVQPGVTFLVSLFDGDFTARLYAADGTQLYQWPIDLFEVDFDEKAHRFHTLIHGAHLYENGDILANLDGQGLMRISRCGEIVWQNALRPHHAIDIAPDGTIWTPASGEMEVEPRLADTPLRFDRVRGFSPDDGALREDLDLKEPLVRAGYQGIVSALRNTPTDVLHVNDVEVLRPEMAAAFPLFEAGDLMVNARNKNQIWILDGQTMDLKWWMTGPMSGAHDPDFQPDGTITLFDNRPLAEPRADTGWTTLLGGSRILQIDPVTRATATLWPTEGGEDFYTPFRGKHQMLDNGNVLMAETDAGRALELTPEGQIAWQYVNAYDDTQVAWMMSAMKYPESHAAFAAQPCP